jgi:uncharacterized protein
VPYEFDAAKNARNVAKHGVDFESAENFDWETALVVEDMRRNYGERRFRALGLIGGRLHSMAFALRGINVRIISLRKANSREETKHEGRS